MESPSVERRGGGDKRGLKHLKKIRNVALQLDCCYSYSE